MKQDMIDLLYLAGDGQTFELNRAAKVDSRGARLTTSILILLLQPQERVPFSASV